jgi:peroxiredoxin
VVQTLTDALKPKLGRSRVSIVLVLQSPAKAVRNYAKTQRFEFEVVADPESRLAKTYNAFWTPRVYALVGGQLRWVQEQASVDDREILMAISRIESKGGE